MAKEQTPSKKKGPHRMATAHKLGIDEDISDSQLDAEVDAFVRKVHSTIQDARSKMSDDEVERADQKAKVILDRATSAAKSARA
jgi:hypothetical protein